MEYMTLKEASQIWKISPRMINYYCSAGRIPGAEKNGDGLAYPKECNKTIRRTEKICQAIRRRTT